MGLLLLFGFFLVLISITVNINGYNPEQQNSVIKKKCKVVLKPKRLRTIDLKLFLPSFLSISSTSHI